MLSCQTKWIIWVIIVSVITLRNEKNGQFDILHDISEHVTLIQLMESVGDYNNAVIIVGYLILEYNYKYVLPLTLDSLNIICSPTLGEGMFAMFETMFQAVR